MITGGFQSREHINLALNDGIDLVGVGRPMILNPDLVNQISNGSDKIFQNDMRRSRWHYLNVVTMLSWWELQMRRIAKGRSTKPNMHVLHAAIHAVTHIGVKAFAPRRG
jgi:imidazole glycerol phosphate synthase subunit HisF